MSTMMRGRIAAGYIPALQQHNGQHIALLRDWSPGLLAQHDMGCSHLSKPACLNLKVHVATQQQL